MWDFGQRMLVLGAGVLFAAAVGLYYWSAAGLTIATILGTVFAGWQVYQGFRPKVAEAAERLRGLVQDNWGTWRALLLGDADPADVEFTRDDDLRLGRVANAGPEGQLTSIYLYYGQLVPARLVILGPPGPTSSVTMTCARILTPPATRPINNSLLSATPDHVGLGVPRWRPGARSRSQARVNQDPLGQPPRQGRHHDHR